MTAPLLPPAGTRSPAGGPTRGVDTPTALAMSAVRERHRGGGCAGGQHYMRRDPAGPADGPWVCVEPGCGLVEPWHGGIAGWLATHQPSELPGLLEGRF